jgi:hypothetical protein
MPLVVPLFAHARAEEPIFDNPSRHVIAAANLFWSATVALAKLLKQLPRRKDEHSLYRAKRKSIKS